MKHQRSLLAYLWVSPVSLLGFGLGLLAYGFGATMKRRFGVIEIAANTRRLAEREQLAKSLAARGEDVTANRQLKLFDETLETDRVEMMALNWMQTVVQYGIDGWTHRYAAISGDDAEVRASALAALSAIKTEVDARAPLVRELASAAQAAIDQQEMRLKDALLDAEATSSS